MHFFQEVTSAPTSTTNTASNGAVERGRLAVPQPGTNSHHSLRIEENQLYKRVQSEEGPSVQRSRLVSPPSRRRNPNTLSAAGEYLSPTRNDTERNTQLYDFQLHFDKRDMLK